MSARPPTTLVWGLLQRGIALLGAFHLVGVAPDLTALIGAKGLEPAAELMASLRHVAGLSLLSSDTTTTTPSPRPTLSLFLAHPTIFWFVEPTDANLNAVLTAAVAFAALAFLGGVPGLASASALSRQQHQPQPSTRGWAARAAEAVSGVVWGVLNAVVCSRGCLAALYALYLSLITVGGDGKRNYALYTTRWGDTDSLTLTLT
jgi:hypothetical protein